MKLTAAAQFKWFLKKEKGLFLLKPSIYIYIYITYQTIKSIIYQIFLELKKKMIQETKF